MNFQMEKTLLPVSNTMEKKLIIMAETLTEKGTLYIFGVTNLSSNNFDLDSIRKKPLVEREDFYHRVVFDPLDYGLALSDNIDFSTMDHRILQVFSRFYNDGYIHNNGDKCFFLSLLLRRILRLHGIEAHVRQVINFYTNLDKGWRQITGEPMHITHGGAVDSHAIVVTKDYILDWAMIKPVHWAFGLRAPIAFIGRNEDSLWDNEQQFGEYGTVIWQRRRDHRDTKNIYYNNRQDVLDFTKEYFKKYRM